MISPSGEERPMTTLRAWLSTVAAVLAVIVVATTVLQPRSRSR
jgi:hypothetical protein